MSMCNVSLVGNLVRPPEQLSFQSGKTKTVFTVAVNNPPAKQGEKEKADFYRCEAWGPLGETCYKYLAKGNQVGVAGRLVMEEWQDREGRTRITPVVTANQISLPPRSQQQQQEPEPQQQQSNDPADIFGNFQE